MLVSFAVLLPTATGLGSAVKKIFAKAPEIPGIEHRSPLLAAGPGIDMPHAELSSSKFTVWIKGFHALFCCWTPAVGALLATGLKSSQTPPPTRNRKRFSTRRTVSILQNQVCMAVTCCS